jgi:hypothetical protein
MMLGCQRTTSSAVYGTLNFSLWHIKQSVATPIKIPAFIKACLHKELIYNLKAQTDSLHTSLSKSQSRGYCIAGLGSSNTHCCRSLMIAICVAATPGNFASTPYS